MIDFLVRNSEMVGLGVFVLVMVGLVYTTVLGMRIGRRLRPEPEPDKDGAPHGVAAVEAALFGLFGLLLAFSFSGAADRFTARKALIREEAQAIGTAYGNLQMLSASAREPLQDRFRDYLDQRIAAHTAGTLDDLDAGIFAAERMGAVILAEAAAACKADGGDGVAEIVVPSITAMIEAGVARKAAHRNHPPLAIFGLLIALSFCAAFMIGMAMAPATRKSWLHVMAFSLINGVTIYVTMDMELPRLGFIRVEGTDLLLHEVRQSWDESR